MECRPDAVGMEKYTVTQKTIKKLRTHAATGFGLCAYKQRSNLSRLLWLKKSTPRIRLLDPCCLNCLWFTHDIANQITLIREIGVMSTNLANMNQLQIPWNPYFSWLSHHFPMTFLVPWFLWGLICYPNVPWVLETFTTLTPDVLNLPAWEK